MAFQPIPRTSSIWASFEMRCVSMDFSYEQYQLTHKDGGFIGAPLNPNEYALVREILNLSMDAAIAAQTN